MNRLMPNYPAKIPGLPSATWIMVEDGIVSFREVTIGIAGTEYFEVLSGVSVGDSLVAGPYQIIRQLGVGDAVRHREGVIVE